MTRRLFGVIVALMGLYTALSGMASAADKPNIVVILLDDLGWTDLGCYGSRFYRTPHVDRLAAGGMRFTQAYAACPVCSPTRAALLTGKYPARLGLTDFIPGEQHPERELLLRPDTLQQLPREEVTLPEVLRTVGYVTAAIGKWHLGGPGFEPQQHGFDVALGGFERGSVASHFAPYLKDGRQLPGLENPPEGEWVTDRLTAEAERFLERHVHQPFFLYLSHYAVHTPLQARPDAVARYAALKSSGPQRNPVFAAMVEAMDNSVGRILNRTNRRA